jgi:hypothetical protein
MERKTLIKFWTTFTKQLIIINPGRFLILSASILLLFLGSLVPNKTNFYKLERHIVDGDTHYYETTSSYNVLEYDSEQKLFQDDGDTLIKVVEWHELRVISVVLSIILFGIFIASLFLEELELDKVRKKTIKSNFTERNIDGEWIYTSYNKLIFRSSYRKLDPIEIPTRILKSTDEFFNLENFFTKAEIRDNKLNKLGI